MFVSLPSKYKEARNTTLDKDHLVLEHKRIRKKLSARLFEVQNIAIKMQDPLFTRNKEESKP